MILDETPDAPGWHSLASSAVIDRLTVDPDAGLSLDDVAQRRRRWGDNALPEPRRRSVAAVLLGQFRSPLIYLLLGAAVIAGVLGEISDAIVIAAVVLINAVIGAVQEGRAESALVALRRLAAQQARVVRDGSERVVDARELVPGDLLVLGAGDAVTADARLLEAAALQASEAALTGESVPVGKGAAPVARDAPLADRASMLHAGTLVTAGRARAVVVAIGAATEIGRIAGLADAVRAQPSPLERRIARFGRIVMIGAAMMFLVFIAVGAWRGLPVATIAMIAISQVVGLVPEGLPVAMTIGLAVGVQRMARRGAIVRRLAAVETLGAITVICSDKTGTLTRGEMTATAIWLPDGREIEITGSGYAPDGVLRERGRPIASADPELARLLEAFALCNDARVVEAGGQWRITGDPTEAALVTAAMKGGVSPDELRRALPRRAELPFDADVKMMATEHATAAGPRIVIKGAAERVLELCALRDEDRRRAHDAIERMAGGALRVLAFAELAGASIDGAGYGAWRGRATLLGLAGEIDPPRAEAVRAVADCRSAGIRPVMVTGDHTATAVAVARTLDIFRDGDLAIDARELDRRSDRELAAILDRVAVFARVEPAQKLRIVEAYQRRGAAVAMTGDGVNDAPALVRADVGVAMGITGTDAAKDAAKIVITDDNFGTIVAAVEEGRVVRRNLKKAVLFLTATSLAEVIVLLAAIALGYPPPFAAVQILWNNLVTEGVVTVNLVMDPAEGDELAQAPPRADEPLITRPMLWRLAVMTPAIAIATLGWFIYRTSAGVPVAVASTETFTLLAVCEWFNVLNCMSERSAFSLRLLRNPWLLGGLVAGNLLQVAVVFVPACNEIFHTVPFSLGQVLAIGAVGSVVLWAEELRKLIARTRRAPAPRLANVAP